MKTEIRTFRDEFAEQLKPFLGQLKTALADMADKPGSPTLKRWRLRLQEALHRADSLSDKIAEQYAYLLLFGPLKSGKSTLMNAIASSYVSEVSSLPAYPALVYVRHGEQQAFQATTYAGKKIDFDSSEAMSQAIADAHSDLAQKMLEIEKTDESFDAHEHFSDAIRRMDVTTPAEALSESGSVLVDTPGLYTRMRFGYDAMTRDFRDHASCAVFVVKSDNLFFEKVFEEFNELLGLFSRIFLVVNIDSSKRDLNADGSFKPSLESERPEAIVEAFHSLAMSAPLRDAYEKGNLNVYTIDLLQAASKRLKERAENAPEGSAADEATEAGFDRFLGDLTEYLNSSDYLREFMRDSLRVGDNLQEEVEAVVSREAPSKLDQDREESERLRDESQRQLAAIETLEKVDWDAAFEGIFEEKDHRLNELADKNRTTLRDSLSEAVDRWMNSDDSLSALREDYLNNLIARETADDAKSTLQRLRDRMDTRHGGARFSPEEMRALDQSGLDMSQIVPDVLQELGSESESSPPRIALPAEDVPIKRSFVDAILFRKHATVRRRFFGDEGERQIPADQKAKRIDEKRREELRKLVSDYPAKDLPRAQEEYVDRVLGNYIDVFKESLQMECEQRKRGLQERIDEREAELEANRQARGVFEILAAASNAFRQSIEELQSRYQTGDLHDDSASIAAHANGSEVLSLNHEQLDHVRDEIGRIQPSDSDSTEVEIPSDGGARNR